MGAIFSLIADVFKAAAKIIYEFAKWFYLQFLPFVIQYIGLPLFFLGILMALAFAGGTVIFTVVFFICMYFFIKGTIINSKPPHT